MYIQRLGTGNLYQLTEPLGLKGLAAFVESKGYKARVFSGSVHEAVTVIQKESADQGLDALGLYCDYENRSVVESFCRRVKDERNLPVFVGGPQTVALGEEFLNASRCDAFVRSEGEYPLYHLLEHFIRGRGDLNHIEGVSYLGPDGRLKTRPPGKPIPILDDLPIRLPGKDLTSQKKQGTLALLTGRGCPFKCAFCYEGSVPGKVRLRGVDHVIKEIRLSLEQNPQLKFIWFADDTFTLNPRRMEDFSRELSALRKTYDFVWFCECHPSTLIRWPQILPMMLESGLVRMQIGIETGSARVLKMYKKQTTLEQIEKVVSLCMDKGLPQLVGNIIIGGAMESRHTFAETKRFTARLLELGPGMLEITSTFFMPFPNTALTEDPAAYGLIIIDQDSLTSKNDIAVTETSELSRQDITALRSEFTRHIMDTMSRLYREGKVPAQRIRRDIRLNLECGMESAWYQYFYSSDKALKNYHTLLARGEIIPLEQVRPEELWDMHPRRTIKLWESIAWDQDNAVIGGTRLSPLDFELLLRCDGECSLGHIRDLTYPRFKGGQESPAEFSSTVLESLRLFADHLWLGFT